MQFPNVINSLLPARENGMFLAIAFVTAAGVLLAALSSGGRSALRGGWLVSMLILPNWIGMSIGSLLLQLRTVAGLTALVGLAIAPDPNDSDEPRARQRFLVSDALMGLLFLCMIISQLNCGRLSPLTIPDLARRWLLPYVMGRLFFASIAEIDRAMVVIVWIMTLVSCLAIFEAVAQVNLVNRMLGRTSFGLLDTSEGYRWGLKRAHGALDHPIFFGMMLVMILPWTLDAARRALRGAGPRWWVVTPVLMCGAIVVTVSRGAQIATLITLAVTAFFGLPRLRVLLLSLALVGGVVGYAGRDVISSALAAMAGEKEEDVTLLEIKGEEYEYTGTKHRLLLYKAYQDYIENAGWFGYGAEMIGVTLEESIELRFTSIDNHYVLFQLQHGNAALVLFWALGLVGIYQLGRIGLRKDHPAAFLAGSLCGAVISVTIMLFSVWFSSDFGAGWLFTVGVASNLRLLPLPAPVPDPATGAEVIDVEVVEEDWEPTPAVVLQRPAPLPGAPRPRPGAPLALPAPARERRLSAGHAPIRRPPEAPEAAR